MNKIFSELKHHCCIAVNKNAMYFYSSKYILCSIFNRVPKNKLSFNIKERGGTALGASSAGRGEE